MPKPRGPYQLKRRAERRDENRERLVIAAADLHGGVGPAFTSMADVAARAGVSAMTAYRHFPTEADLFRACGAHFIAGHPLPAAESWNEIVDPVARITRALSEIYRYYRTHEVRMANVLRDSLTMPVGGVFRDAERAWSHALLRAFPAAQRRRPVLRGAVAMAVRFETWHHLARLQRLGDRQIIAVMLAATSSAPKRPTARAA